MKNNSYNWLKLISVITIIGINVLQFKNTWYGYRLESCGLDGAISFYVCGKNIACGVMIWLLIVLFYGYTPISTSEILKYDKRENIFFEKIRQTLKEIMITNLQYMILSVIIQQFLSGKLINWGKENALVGFKPNIILWLVGAYIYSCITIFLIWEIAYLISISLKNRTLAIAFIIFYSFLSCFFNFNDSKILKIIYVYSDTTNWGETTLIECMIVDMYLLLLIGVVSVIILRMVKRMDYLNERDFNI